ncbi:MAG: transcriptional regulator [Phenylobacterium sp.]|uniref:ArsR/SmtB family transcription factor n=1 Tax=Phenylobacterium sp. TaxID=1871053 RepID=UPI0012285B71|nr:metalloregulator ArsR/SmtB family transcription factor [Phenylobacterium sp.]TAJ69888.1 MAG: transcriptional regulator [Phenylobacterium sp.]
METNDAVDAMSALAHPGRMNAFRLLVQAGAGGLPAGEIASRLGMPASSLSTNLNILSQAGLVNSRRESRSIIYSADYEAMRTLLTFLMEDCCAGVPEICAPLAAVANSCCSPEPPHA